MTPSTVTCCSPMASSKADCAFGEARLISSASTMPENTGPGRNSKLPEFRSNTDVPVMSTGSRSGVNWMRPKLTATLRASALPRLVLPTPGTSSISTWPPDTNASMSKSTTSDLPFTASSIFSRMRVNCSSKRAMSGPAYRPLV